MRHLFQGGYKRNCSVRAYGGTYANSCTARLCCENKRNTRVTAALESTRVHIPQPLITESSKRCLIESARFFFSIIVEQEAQAYTSTRTHAVKQSMRGSLTRNQLPDLLVTNWPISTPLRPYVCFASCDRKIIIEGEEELLLDCVNII